MELTDIIVDLTDKKHRKYDDEINNPALAISIIDTAFACFKVFGSETIESNHFIQAIQSNYRLYEGAKEEAIKRIKTIKINNHPKKLTKTILLMPKN